MLLPEKIQEYCEEVSDQIRWKKVRPVISSEIENHLLDQRDEYMHYGLDEEIATDKAILQMGDPVQVGLELDKTHKPKPQWFCLGFVSLLIIIGVFLQYLTYTISNSSSLLSYDIEIGICIVSISVLFACYFLDFTILGKYPFKIYCGTVIFSLLLLIAIKLNIIPHTYNYIKILGLSISTAYLSLIFPVVYALFVYKMRNRGYMGIIYCGLAYIPFAFVLICFGGSKTGIYTLVSLIILCTAIAKNWFNVKRILAFAIVFGSVFIVLLICAYNVLFSDYLLNKIMVFINPNNDPYGSGYIYNMLRTEIANASFIGQGQMSDVFTYSDYHFVMGYIFAFLTAKYGIIFLIGIILVFSILMFIILKKIVKQKSKLGFICALTIALIFIFQAIFYIAFSLGYSFLAVLPFPFLTEGNTCLILNSALMGFMLSIFRTGYIYKDKLNSQNSNIQNEDEDDYEDDDEPMFTYQKGKLTINFNKFL